MPRLVTLEDAKLLPPWRRPEALLLLMALGMALAFRTWSAALNNFVVDASAFNGLDIGVLHTVRETPGFLAFLVIYIVIVIREQTLALTALCLLGLGTAVVAEFPAYWGIMATTIISSIGFHYYEAVSQSLQLQWLDKERAPKALGWIVAAGSAGALVVFGSIALAGRFVVLNYDLIYMLGGGACVAIAVFCYFAYPQFRATHVQARGIVLKRRYWLYYALVFMGGARRQIFVVFAAFMMVEKFGFELHEVTALFLINYVANIVFAPMVGRLIASYGERIALIIEYVGLIAVFSLYAGIYFFDWGVLLAMALYVVDHLLFAIAFAQKTYFQKIADPQDHAPTAAVAFTINHIAAVTLPAPLGLLWLWQPGVVYGLAAGMAGVSLALACLVPRHPAPGAETAFTVRKSPAAAAE